MEQENKSLSLLGLYSESHFYRNSVQSYPVLVSNVLKIKDLIDVSTKVADFKVGAEESLRNSTLTAQRQLDNTIFRVGQRIGLFCHSLFYC